MNCLLKCGNKKLSNKIGIWNLPRSTCINAGVCKDYCYAKSFENMKYPKKFRESRLEISKTDLFEKLMIAEIKNNKFKYIRIHESGDYYSIKYFVKWINIAKACPNVTFLSFTKSFNILDLNGLPNNFTIFQSYGSKTDSEIDVNLNTARVIDNINQLNSNEFLCPYHDKAFTKCGEYCNYCWTLGVNKKVAFLKH